MPEDTSPARRGASRAKLTAGTRLGKYEVVAHLGSGGMGDVYRAHDPSLGRDVAVKLLPAGGQASPDRLRRFEQEARVTGALNHPNILAVYDFGTHEGGPYLVSQVLEGVTLGRYMVEKQLGTRRALDVAIAIASGLAAAHDKGVVHRDLKPDNVFVTRDGRVKILHFGIAKLTAREDEEPKDVRDGPTLEAALTADGAMIGTLEYMSAEQVAGRPADARSDLFSLAVMLCEMLCGQRPFRGDTAADLAYSILRGEPNLAPVGDDPPGIDAILSRCLEKDPAERYHSARDLAFHLQSLMGASGTRPRAASAKKRRRVDRRVILWGVAALALALGGAFVAGTRLARHPATMADVRERHVGFERVTYRRGRINGARLAGDGRTVVYAAAWEHEPERVYTTLPGGREARPLTEPGYTLVAVGSHDELALLRKDNDTLARMPIAGTVPRDVIEHVHEADWLPGGELAVLRADPATQLTSIEAPIGRVLYQSYARLSSPRVSPHGDAVAFVEYPIEGDDVGRICVVSPGSAARCLNELRFSMVNGLAWRPDGKEIWFAALEEGSHGGLYGVDLAGHMRTLVSLPGRATLLDVGAAGALIRLEDLTVTAYARPPGAAAARELGWLDETVVTDLSADGRTVLIAEGGVAGTTDYVGYLRATDGSPPVRLGLGWPAALSPDGQRVVTFIRNGAELRLVLQPVGAGAAVEMPRGPIEEYYRDRAELSPDGKRVVFAGRVHGHGWQVWLQDTDGGDPRPMTPEGYRVLRTMVFAPDGGRVIVRNAQSFFLLDLTERTLTQITWPAGLFPLRFGADGRSIVGLQLGPDLGTTLWRVALDGGAQTKLEDVPTVGPITFGMHATPDGMGYVYSTRVFSQWLFVVTGLE